MDRIKMQAGKQRYRVSVREALWKRVNDHPDMTQRQLANSLGCSEWLIRKILKEGRQY